MVRTDFTLIKRPHRRQHRDRGGLSVWTSVSSLSALTAGCLIANADLRHPELYLSLALVVSGGLHSHALSDSIRGLSRRVVVRLYRTSASGGRQHRSGDGCIVAMTAWASVVSSPALTAGCLILSASPPHGLQSVGVPSFLIGLRTGFAPSGWESARTDACVTAEAAAAPRIFP